MEMKKIIITALAVSAAMLSCGKTHACTNLLITKGAMKDSSNVITYSADSHTRYGFLAYLPGGRHRANAMREIYDWGSEKYLGSIPEARRTYNVLGNMNEHQLIIGESTWEGLKSHRDPDGMIDYGSMMFIALQRCRTAREAIKTMTSLANEYGYASSGESFSIADKNEVWILELISKKPKYDQDSVNINKGIVWVAIRIPDGCISAHANAARITEIPADDSLNCMYAPDIFSYVKEEKLYDGPDSTFSFADTFCPLDFLTARTCEARVWSFFNRHGAEDMSKYLDFAKGENLKNRMPLYVPSKKPISLKEAADMMRDRYEGTWFDMTNDLGAGGNELPYRWRPMTYHVNGNDYLNERAIATQQTAFWFVAQARSYYPDHIGGILWFGVDDAGTSPLTPVYACSLEISEHYSEMNGSMVDYSPTSMFWLTNRIAQFSYLRYNQIGREVRTIIDEHEKDMMEKVKDMDEKAMEIYISSSTKKSIKYLTKASVTLADYLFYKWKKLDEYLLVKYIDGNTKKQDRTGQFITNDYTYTIPVAPEQPGYTDSFLKRIAESEEGARLKLPAE